MFAKIVLGLTFFFLIAPILTTLHELSHAAIPALNGEEVKVSVGKSSIFNLHFRNLKVELGLLKPWIGYTDWSRESTVLQLFLGPLVSLALGISFYILSSRVEEFKGLLLACTGWCLFQFLFTIVPVKYPTFLGYSNDQKSDGWQAAEILKKSYTAKQ
jgi:hypothetical protein